MMNKCTFWPNTHPLPLCLSSGQLRSDHLIENSQTRKPRYCFICNLTTDNLKSHYRNKNGHKSFRYPYICSNYKYPIIKSSVSIFLCSTDKSMFNGQMVKLSSSNAVFTSYFKVILSIYHINNFEKSICSRTELPTQVVHVEQTKRLCVPCNSHSLPTVQWTAITKGQ